VRDFPELDPPFLLVYVFAIQVLLFIESLSASLPLDPLVLQAAALLHALWLLGPFHHQNKNALFYARA